MPHLQPPAVQRSAAVALQAVHAPPPTPHADTEATRQPLVSQHPALHEVALQTHAPATQLRPAAQAAPAPHLHAPPEQVSACCGLQPVQASPLVPHAVAVGIVHVAPEQQPVGHDVASQMQSPALHRWPAPHGPPAPHAH